MTDLENLWNDLPTDSPPLDAIVQAGRAEAVRRRRRVTVPLMATAASVALIGAFVVGTTVGGPDDPVSALPGGDASPVAFYADLQPVASCEELLTSYRERGLALVSEWGWTNSWFGYGAMTELTSAHSRAAAGLKSATTTNVQEQGVDEPDTVKTDGDLVIRLRGTELLVYDASGSSVERLSATRVPNVNHGDILISGSTVVVMGADRLATKDNGGTRVVTISIADPSQPTIEATTTYSSSLVTARLHDSAVRLVLAEGLPDLDFISPHSKKVTRKEARQANRQAVKTSTIEDWLPTYVGGGVRADLLDCTQVAIPPDALGLDTVSIVGFSPDEPTSPHAIGLASTASIAYASTDHLVLADSPDPWGCPFCGRLAATGGTEGGTSYLYDFELDGIDAVQVASGEVEGTIADRWSMDEVAGILRVAVGPSTETGNFNSVVTFTREGKDLVEIGRVGKLGVGEELKGVRWFDDLAVLVTYLEVDPLYTIGLSDPAHPQRLGKLKIPGFSDYLHPLGDDQMMGIGVGASWSAQIALFDISDLARTRQTDVDQFPRSQAIVTWDARAFTWIPDQQTVLTVLQKGRNVKLAEVKINDGTMDTTLTTVDYGDDASLVRTFAMSDGRIILVTGDDVRFYQLH